MQKANIFKGCIRFFAVLTLSVSIFSTQAFAETDRQDLLVGLKTLPLLTNKFTGTVQIAILFDANNPASRDEAKNIKSIIDNNFELPGDLKLVPILIPAGEPERMASSKIAILTSDLGRHYDAINSEASRDGILTMSTDLSCVRANKCVIGIVSKPHVEIYYSKVAADSAKVIFGQVFTMLVKQL